MQYDAILCVTPHHNHIAHYSINSLFLFTSVHRIFVITQTQNFPSFTTLIKKHKDKIILLNEDNIITGVNKRTLDQFFIEKTGNADRNAQYRKTGKLFFHYRTLYDK